MELDDDGFYNPSAKSPAPIMPIERVLSWCIWYSLKTGTNLNAVILRHAVRSLIVSEDHWLL